MSASPQPSPAQGEGLNKHWLVCRKCLTAWPPNDVAEDNVHYDGPEEGPWERCDGELIELDLASDLQAVEQRLKETTKTSGAGSGGHVDAQPPPASEDVSPLRAAYHREREANARLSERLRRAEQSAEDERERRFAVEQRLKEQEARHAGRVTALREAREQLKEMREALREAGQLIASKMDMLLPLQEGDRIIGLDPERTEQRIRSALTTHESEDEKDVG